MVAPEAIRENRDVHLALTRDFSFRVPIGHTISPSSTHAVTYCPQPNTCVCLFQTVTFNCLG